MLSSACPESLATAVRVLVPTVSVPNKTLVRCVADHEMCDLIPGYRPVSRASPYLLRAYPAFACARNFNQHYDPSGYPLSSLQLTQLPKLSIERPSTQRSYV